MEEIKSLQNKYKFATIAADITTPYKYIPQEIKELSDDLKNIDTIMSKTKDMEVIKLCKFLKSKLYVKKKFFEELRLCCGR